VVTNGANFCSWVFRSPSPGEAWYTSPCDGGPWLTNSPTNLANTSLTTFDFNNTQFCATSCCKLQPGQYYQIQIYDKTYSSTSGCVERGDGGVYHTIYLPPSDSSSLPTDAPYSPSAIVTTQNSLTLSWDPPTYVTTPAQYYQLAHDGGQGFFAKNASGIQFSNDPSSGTLITTNDTSTQITINGLVNGLTYRFAIRAQNGIGWSPWSHWLGAIFPVYQPTGQATTTQQNSGSNSGSSSGSSGTGSNSGSSGSSGSSLSSGGNPTGAGTTSFTCSDGCLHGTCIGQDNCQCSPGYGGYICDVSTGNSSSTTTTNHVETEKGSGSIKIAISLFMLTIIIFLYE